MSNLPSKDAFTRVINRLIVAHVDFSHVGSLTDEERVKVRDDLKKAVEEYHSLFEQIYAPPIGPGMAIGVHPRPEKAGE